jgi:hypothetical protein
MKNELIDMVGGNALSRTTRMLEDTPVYVCSPCGEDEAMLDFAGIGQRETWPIMRNLLSWRDLTSDEAEWLST